jgi:NAD(P) transhydrogenase subunit alpha
VQVEAGAGRHAYADDGDYVGAGAAVVGPDGIDAALGEADVVATVRPLDPARVARLHAGATTVSLLQPGADLDTLRAGREAGITALSFDLLPRISRAQSMDVLSSQALVTGYRAALVAADRLPRFFPLFMTAAGTVQPARVLVLGAGVAGLQAIATAKRLGAVIEASDVRPSVKDQVESLGGKWVDVPYANDEERQIAEGAGGYARPMPPEWMARQAGIIAERCKNVDILITTALIPGRPAPKLIKADTVAAMKSGAVIVDLAVEQGGNVEGSQLDQIVAAKNGVKIVGFANLPARVPADASALYARNVLNFLSLSLNAKTGEFAVPKDDEIIKATLVCENGVVVPRS